MKKTLISNLVFVFILSISVSADDHMESTGSFPGLISSEIFDLDGKMDLHIERRKTCNQNAVAKHFHPASGTVVYVLDGKSQSKSTGKWKTYKKDEYWFERTDWVHGGEEDAPELEEGTCSDLLVIRVTDKGKDHTVFID